MGIVGNIIFSFMINNQQNIFNHLKKTKHELFFFVTLYMVFCKMSDCTYETCN